MVKKRTNKSFDKHEIESLASLKGNFSGKPTFAQSNQLIRYIRTKFSDRVVLIGLGGVFTYQDAQAKFAAGADMVQLATGLIFEGPQIAGDINSQIIKNGFRAQPRAYQI